MGRYRCPSCSTIVEANDPSTLVCPSCGYGGGGARQAAPSQPQPSQQYPQPQGGGQQPSYGGGGYGGQQQPYGGAGYGQQPYGGGGYAPPGGYGGPPSGGYGAAAPKASGMAVTALVMGLISLCIYVTPITGLLAIIFGAIAINQVKKNPQQVGGKGMAIAGLIIGSIMLGLYILFIIFVGLAFLSDPSAWEEAAIIFRMMVL